MPEQTGHRTPLDLQAVREAWLSLCGACDAGLPTNCTCPAGDYRPVLLRAVDDLERARKDTAVWSWRAGSVRGALHRVVGMIPSGPVRNRIAEVVADVDRELFEPGGCRADRP